MTKKTVFANIGRFFGVYFISAALLAAVFLLVGVFDSVIGEHTAMTVIYFGLTALCSVSPILFGRLILKSTGTASGNFVSLLIPAAILSAVIFVLLYIFTAVSYNYSVSMIICMMNFPMYILTQFTPEGLFVSVIAFMPFVTAITAFIGLMTKTKKRMQGV